MSLQRFTDACRSYGRARRLIWQVACIVFLGGCASDSGQRPHAGAGSEPFALREISPEALTMYERAVAAMAAGDSLEAQLRFQEFLLQYPDLPGAHINLAIIYANIRDDAATEASLGDALALDAEHPAALNQLGMLRRRQGRFAEAEAAYLKAVTAHPDYALAHYNLGVLNELYLQRYDVALQHFVSYQTLAGENEQVARWIVDLERRIGSDRRSAKTEE
jgi:tetratricopeptide (TPR) repeat protein